MTHFYSVIKYPTTSLSLRLKDNWLKEQRILVFIILLGEPSKMLCLDFIQMLFIFFLNFSNTLASQINTTIPTGKILYKKINHFSTFLLNNKYLNQFVKFTLLHRTFIVSVIFGSLDCLPKRLMTLIVEIG